jgi:hypothetical protein
VSATPHPMTQRPRAANHQQHPHCQQSPRRRERWGGCACARTQTNQAGQVASERFVASRIAADAVDAERGPTLSRAAAGAADRNRRIGRLNRQMGNDEEAHSLPTLLQRVDCPLGKKWSNRAARRLAVRTVALFPRAGKYCDACQPGIESPQTDGRDVARSLRMGCQPKPTNDPTRRDTAAD